MSAAAAPARFSALTGIPTAWARQSAEGAAAALKIVSDLTAQQVALLIGMMRERFNRRSVASAVEFSGRFVAGSAEAGKIVLDLAAGESAVMADALKEVLQLRPSVAALVDIVPRSVGTLVEMHKALLDAIAENTQEAVDAYTEDKPFINIPGAAKAARDGIERFVKTQKTLLDQVSEQISLATEASKDAKPKKAQAHAVIELAKDGVEKFIDAQKQILELVVERAEAEETHARIKPAPSTSLAELTRKSVQNFTTAQKSLLDLAIKPIAAPAEAPKHRPVARKKPAARKKAVAETASAT